MSKVLVPPLGTRDFKDIPYVRTNFDISAQSAIVIACAGLLMYDLLIYSIAT